MTPKKELQMNDHSAGTVESRPIENAFIPTTFECILLVISFAFMYERTSQERVLPFRIDRIGGIIPPECLIWTFILANMAARDIWNLYRGSAS
jgi:hypothetical protein